MKITDFCVVIVCCVEGTRRFGGKYNLNISVEVETKQEIRFPPASLLWFIF
jgi:hypothetical protein